MEKTILYINDEYCLSLEQLKAYFAKTLQPESSLYDELLTLQCDGLLAKWLGESPDEEELHLARELDNLSSGMADSDLMTELKRIFTGSQEGVAKPDPSQFLELTSILCLADGKEISLSKNDNLVYHGIINRTKKNGFCEETDVKFQFTFKVLKRVNEEYSVELVYTKDNILPIGVLSPNSQREGDILQFSLPPIGVTQQGEYFFLMVDGEPWATIYLSINVVRWTFTVKGVPFDMIFVEGDTFKMGATPEQDSDRCVDEEPIHDVILSSYYIGETVVTQDLWQAVMGSISYYKGKNHAMDCVSWSDCQDFIVKLNALLKEQLEDLLFQLPTEAQWEFAARGGKIGKYDRFKYAGSNDIDRVALYEGNYRSDRPSLVRQKMPNQLGLYDMSGLVREWCYDWYDSYSGAIQTNPRGPSVNMGFGHVLRSGHDSDYSFMSRVSSRKHDIPEHPGFGYGFRLALIPSDINSNRESMAFMEMNYHYRELEKHILERLKQRKT